MNIRCGAGDIQNDARSKYKLIMFDLGNTVIRFDHHISAKKLAGRFGLNEQSVHDMFFDSEVTRLFDEGKVSTTEFYERVRSMLSIGISYDGFFDIWHDIFEPDEEVCAIVRTLKERCPVFLISNTNEAHFTYIKNKYHIMKAFNGFILSYEVGCLKPDIRIYEAAARAGNASFSEMLYIDDRDDLVSGSTALGIDSIRFESAGQLRNELGKRGVL
ncbi:MAG: HAD family phosphatase [Candidatus Omnitrophota bacterium]